MALCVDRIMIEAATNFKTRSDEARRLFHGRGGCFPDCEMISLDYYPPALHLIVYQEVSEYDLGSLCATIQEAFSKHIKAAVLQKRYLRQTFPECLWGRWQDLPAEALENGMRFSIDLHKKQNIGFFLDMQEGRRLVRQRAAGRRVLNLFAYTCSFSVAALLGGAAETLNVDMNRPVLQIGKENHLRNGIDLRKAGFLAHDVLKSTAKLNQLGPFDLIIIDPPTQQGRSFQIERDYPKLIRKLPRYLQKDGEILCCLNTPWLKVDFLLESLNHCFPRGEIVDVLGPPATFKECSSQQSGLKIIYYRTKHR